MSSVNRVSDVRAQQIGQERLSEAQLRRRIELHTTDSVERASSLRRASEGMALPPQDENREAALQSLYQSATPEQQLALAQGSAELAGQLYSASAAGNLSSTSAGLSAAMTHATEMYIMTSGEQRIDQVTTGVMYMAIDGIDQDLYGLATQLQDHNEQSSAKREEIAEFRNTLADWPEGAETQEFTWTEVDPKTGKVTEKTEQLKRDAAEKKLDNLEEEFGQMRGMTEQFQLSLQDAMQKQQAAMQLLSNIIKNFHDTAKSIIQNLRG